MKRIYKIIILMMIFSASVYAASPVLVDEANYLTHDEGMEISSMLNNIRNTYNIDAAVVIVNSIGGKTVEEYADDYYDYNGYGMGADDDGILLLISKNPRKYHITTYAAGIKIFNDSALDYMAENIESHLRNEDYYGACGVFAEMAESFVDSYINGAEYEQYSEYIHTENAYASVGALIYVLPIALIFAIIMTVKAYRGMNTARTPADANLYVKYGSMHITKSNDIFLYSNVTKTKIESSSGGSGGSSTHRSSSGRTHGGRGGSY